MAALADQRMTIAACLRAAAIRAATARRRDVAATSAAARRRRRATSGTDADQRRLRQRRRHPGEVLVQRRRNVARACVERRARRHEGVRAHRRTIRMRRLPGGFTHWIVTDIPATTTSLPAAVPAGDYHRRRRRAAGCLPRDVPAGGRGRSSLPFPPLRARLAATTWTPAHERQRRSGDARPRPRADRPGRPLRALDGTLRSLPCGTVVSLQTRRRRNMLFVGCRQSKCRARRGTSCATSSS